MCLAAGAAGKRHFTRGINTAAHSALRVRSGTHALLRTPRSKAPLPICMLITLIWDEKKRKERKTHMCVFTPRVGVSQFTVRVTSCLYFEGSTFDVTTHFRRCSVGVAPPFLSVFLFFQVSRFSSQSAHSWKLSLRRKISPVCNR